MAWRCGGCFARLALEVEAFRGGRYAHRGARPQEGAHIGVYGQLRSVRHPLHSTGSTGAPQGQGNTDPGTRLAPAKGPM